MKKIAKIAVGITLAASLAAGAGAIAGCSKNATGEAYGLVHNGGYVGYSKITKNGDKVKDLTLTEVCLPTQVKATDSVAEADKVTVGNNSFYKTVSYGSVTLVYDTTANDYMVGTQAFKSYLQEEANCKAYYEAVVGNQVKVTVGGSQDANVMTKATLSKEENGYWTSNGVSKWKANRDATVNYVKEHGVANLDKLVKNDETKIWMDGSISTGATWNDLNSDTTGKNYYSYAQLILKANDAAKK